MELHEGIAQQEEVHRLAKQLFAGPDLWSKWYESSHPEALGGETPMEAWHGGRTQEVLDLLRFLARGA